MFEIFIFYHHLGTQFVLHAPAFRASIRYSRFTDAAGSEVARIFTERAASSQTKQQRPGKERQKVLKT
jgi:hypothetical protein